MLAPADQSLVKRAMLANKCVLFLGAGFSREATGRNGLAVPGGDELARRFWKWLGYDSTGRAYDPLTDPLDKLFDVARKKKGDKALSAFLEENLLAQEVPDWYSQTAFPYFYRVYTTNVDDVLERAYSAAGIELDPINAVTTRYRERSELLDSLQYVKLNGTLGGPIEGLTFGLRQFADRMVEYDPWYDHFVRDYTRHTTILVGTQVSEPMFWRVVEERRRRAGAAIELRTRSFLVAPNLSPVLVDSLGEFNVVPVDADAHSFFVYLRRLVDPLPEIGEVLLQVNPAFVMVAGALRGKARRDQELFKAFFTAFKLVEPREVPRGYRSTLLLGSSPTWTDIDGGFDAPRNQTLSLLHRIAEGVEKQSRGVFVVSGHTGSGKSTAIMRIGADLAAQGFQVFFARGDDVPEVDVVVRAIDRLQTAPVLLIDDAQSLGGRLNELLSELQNLRVPLTIVLAMRSNSLGTIEGWLPLLHHAPLERLTDADIARLVAHLREKGFLGSAARLDDGRVEALFRERLDRQLLVALLEVTRDDQFHRIIATEYAELGEQELKLLYLTAAVAYSAGSAVTKDQLLASSTWEPARVLSAFEQEFRNILVGLPTSSERMAPRHELIAESIADRAPLEELRQAYERLAAVLFHDMDPSARSGPGRTWFRLYKKIINHQVIFRRFRRDMEQCRTVYESMRVLAQGDSHFWLQYGTLELQDGGDLRAASIYLTTAAGLNPDDWFISNAIGHLRLLEACGANSRDAALRLLEEGKAVLAGLIERYGDISPYPWHTLIAHEREWIRVWLQDRPERRRALEALHGVAEEAKAAHPTNVNIAEVERLVLRDYLATVD